jgi:hypothetical protein
MWPSCPRLNDERICLESMWNLRDLRKKMMLQTILPVVYVCMQTFGIWPYPHGY